MLISNEYDEVITMCNFITRWNIIPKKKKEKKEKKLKLVENLKKKKLKFFLRKFSYKISCNLKLQSYLIK